MILCEMTGEKPVDGACPVHKGDACLTEFIPYREKKDLERRHFHIRAMNRRVFWGLMHIYRGRYEMDEIHRKLKEIVEDIDDELNKDHSIFTEDFISINPAHSWGTPTVANGRFDTEFLASRVYAGRTMKVVADMESTTVNVVALACWYQAIHGRKRKYKDWKLWAEQNHQNLWYGRVPPDPFKDKYR